MCACYVCTHYSCTCNRERGTATEETEREQRARTHVYTYICTVVKSINRLTLVGTRIPSWNSVLPTRGKVARGLNDRKLAETRWRNKSNRVCVIDRSLVFLCRARTFEKRVCGRARVRVRIWEGEGSRERREREAITLETKLINFYDIVRSIRFIFYTRALHVSGKLLLLPVPPPLPLTCARSPSLQIHILGAVCVRLEHRWANIDSDSCTGGDRRSTGRGAHTPTSSPRCRPSKADGNF